MEGDFRRKRRANFSALCGFIARFARHKWRACSQARENDLAHSLLSQASRSGGVLVIWVSPCRGIAAPKLLLISVLARYWPRPRHSPLLILHKCLDTLPVYQDVKISISDLGVPCQFLYAACAVRLFPPLISNLTRVVKFREDTKWFPYVRGFSLNVNILLNIIISQSIATTTINSGTSGWKILLRQSIWLGLGLLFLQPHYASHKGSKSQNQSPEPLSQLQMAGNGYLYLRCVRNDNIFDYLLLLFLSVSCESWD